MIIKKIHYSIIAIFFACLFNSSFSFAEDSQECRDLFDNLFDKVEQTDEFQKIIDRYYSEGRYSLRKNVFNYVVSLKEFEAIYYDCWSVKPRKRDRGPNTSYLEGRTHGRVDKLIRERQAFEKKQKEELAKKEARRRTLSKRTARIKSEKQITEFCLSFVKSVDKKKIAVLPSKCLESAEFKKNLLFNLDKPEEALRVELYEIDQAFDTMVFANNFEKRRAENELKEKKEQLLLESIRKYKAEIAAPVFYHDFITIVDDRENNLYFKNIEVFDFNGVRKAFANDGVPETDIQYLVEAKDHDIDFSVRININSPKTIVPLNNTEKEKLFLSSPQYSGKKRQFKNFRELKGRMYFSLKNHFSTDWRSGVFCLFPVYFELGRYEGKFVSFKPHEREDKDYSDKTLYEYLEVPDAAKTNEALVLLKKGGELAKAGKYQESVYYYEKSIELDPTNESALNNYAYVLKKLGRLEQSLELYNKSLRMASNSSVTLKNRALLYEELAAKEYGKYLELSPNAKDAESVKKRLSRLNVKAN